MNQPEKSSATTRMAQPGENGLASASDKAADPSACRSVYFAEHELGSYSFLNTIPQAIMDQIIYFNTDPEDIVFDPFAGTGVTVDSCKLLSRRFYCSDLYVFPGREQDIKPWDITNGLPPDLPVPDLVILDPPLSRRTDGRIFKAYG